MSKHDVGWAAGFFEGEGYSGFNYLIGYKKRKYPKLTLSIAQVYREPLDKFQEIFGIGKVRGPYGPYGTTKQAYYQYQTSGPKAVEVLEKMIPYLFQKRLQAEQAIKEYKENEGVKT